MSKDVQITDLDNRKMEVSISARDGAVCITKKWKDDQGNWQMREMIVNGDEWERIAEARKNNYA